MEDERPTDAKMDAAMMRRPRPFFNIISLVAPVIIALPFLGVRIVHLPDSGWGWGVIGELLILDAISWFIGLTAGIIALCRRERLLGLTLLGLVINGFPIIRVLFRALVGG